MRTRFARLNDVWPLTLAPAPATRAAGRVCVQRQHAGHARAPHPAPPHGGSPRGDARVPAGRGEPAAPTRASQRQLRRRLPSLQVRTLRTPAAAAQVVPNAHCASSCAHCASSRTHCASSRAHCASCAGSSPASRCTQGGLL